MKDTVNHPENYQNIAGVEAIDILNDVDKDLPGKQAAMLWNSMKYLFRFQKKNGVEDLKKSRNYLDYLIADIEATNEAAKNIMANSSAPKKKEAPKPVDTTYDPCVIYHSKVSGKVEVQYSMQMYAGTCTTLVFTSELARDMFMSSFLNKLGKKRFSIQDILEDAKFLFPKEDNSLHFNMSWNDIFKGFHMTDEGGKYALEFIIDLQGGK